MTELIVDVPERWLPVVGYEGLYEVSSIGNLRTVERKDSLGRRRKSRPRKPALKPDGYLQVMLFKDGVNRNHYVQRLVLEAFAGPCPPLREACHRNDIKTDNRAENLRWGTRQENMIDQARNGRSVGSKMSECIRGHAFDVINTYIKPNGNRGCKECRRTAVREGRIRRSEEAAK
ncbi:MULTISPECIES: NUMOD4 motif-containing HNH endonuclease [unclassified Brevibacterium]|uniref:NUMOD4 motif-containing HNH endonuclease n=1 Tax=unclassified Brevibacterium TaxID=2614124 RepID=UPI001E4BE4BB|nr:MULTISPECIES: NUMOD4 motif-containing HNH endonuclease [unclassified Brevibacterium]MCD1287308.1 hypothetical protein [Brevibacterium sp. CCUG 69071]MDK8436437.1 NUMOD4 motif-containing HNH endonuclease [Brevibacterium sp. H-BE7]